MSSSNRWMELRGRLFPIAWLVVGLLSVLHLLYYGPRTVDDMFIFLRYAENLAAGEGLVYNPGEAVEGFSSPLWVLLLAIGELLGVGGVSWAKVLSVVFWVLLLWGVYAFGRERLALPPALAWLGVVALALDSYVVSWVLWGLETPAYLALLVWTAVLTGRVVKEGTRRDSVYLALAGSAFVLSRPEAPLMIAALGVFGALLPMKREEIVARARRALPSATVVVAAWAGYSVFRRVYFGSWLPHTHYAKQGGGLDPTRLEPLVAQGASIAEVACTVLAVMGALWLFVRRKSAAPLAILAANWFFVAVVAVDWMPNVRHFLPTVIVVPPVVLAIANALFSRGTRRARLGALLPVILVLVSAISIAAVDARFSVFDHLTHGFGERWGNYKSARVVRDTWDCLRRVTPTHVEEMGPVDHGMITQLYRLYESDARPLEETWFVGRDIGRVGWLAGDARIFDTAGLFTPPVVESEAWQADETVDEALLSAAFGHEPVVAFLDAPWVEALWRYPDVVADYRPSRDQLYMEYRYLRPPSRELVLARYAEGLAKMPTHYYLMTLYGEAVGAALEKRYERLLSRHRHLSGGAG